MKIYLIRLNRTTMPFPFIFLDFNDISISSKVSSKRVIRLKAIVIEIINLKSKLILIRRDINSSWDSMVKINNPPKFINNHLLKNSNIYTETSTNTGRSIAETSVWETCKQNDITKKRNKEMNNNLNKFTLYLTNPIKSKKIKINEDSTKLSMYKLLNNTNAFKNKYITIFTTTGTFQTKLSLAK